MLNRKLWEDVDKGVNPQPEDTRFDSNFPEVHIIRQYSDEKLQDEYDKRLFELTKKGEVPHKDRMLGFLAREMQKRFRERKVSFPQESFGIPITKGKLLAKGDHGVVVSFNLRNLHLRRLLRAQMYSANQMTRSEVISPIHRITDLFQLPMMPNAPDVAFAQKEYTAILFVKFPQFEFSENTRLVFWFVRNMILAKRDTDPVDMPNEMIPLLIAETRKQRMSQSPLVMEKKRMP